VPLPLCRIEPIPSIDGGTELLSPTSAGHLDQAMATGVVLAAINVP
jgi:hypothetical protein